MRFGGESQFGGSSQFGGVPYARTPGFYIDRMLESMERFLTSSGGTINTLGRLVGDLTQADTWKQALTKRGLPAVLVYFDGGTFDERDEDRLTSGASYSQDMVFQVFCLANDYRAGRTRLEGLSVYDPGVENIVRWCLFFMMRALVDLNVVNPHPVSETPRIWWPEAAGSVLTIKLTTSMDIYDSYSEAQFLSAGICHTPKDADRLFVDDNVTPNSDNPTATTPSVADLED